MFEIYAFFAILVISVILVLLAVKLRKNPDVKVTDESGNIIEIEPPEGDEDIKIAGDKFETNTAQEDDVAEEAAREYLIQKERGNIEAAGKFGELMADRLWEISQELIMNTDGYTSEKEVHQQIVLLSYAVNAYISNESPNKLLAETAISVFYKHADDLSSILYKHVSDTAAFSMYILAQRNGIDEEEIGRIYAKLCGKEDDRQKIDQGIEIYKRFYKKCENVFNANIEYNL